MFENGMKGCFMSCEIDSTLKHLASGEIGDVILGPFLVLQDNKFIYIGVRRGNFFHLHEDVWSDESLQ